MERAYVAGPYRAPTWTDIEQNIQEARAIAIALWQFGYAVFCPHMNTAHFDGLADDAVWLEGDLEWVRVSQLLVLHPRWEESSGAQVEKVEAEACRIPVFFWATDQEALRERIICTWR